MAGSPDRDQPPQSGLSPRGLDIFRELSASFARFVEVIGEVANATIARGAASSRGLIRLYERWLKTRSDKLAEALTSHGFIAPGAPGGGPRGGGVLS